MLRRLIFPSGEERYIRSLARCRQWKAHGGKSGSMFCKTHGGLSYLCFLSVDADLESESHYLVWTLRLMETTIRFR